MPAGECALRALRERSRGAKRFISYLHLWHVFAKEMQQRDGSIGVMHEKCKREKMEKWVSLISSFLISSLKPVNGYLKRMLEHHQSCAQRQNEE